MFLNDIELEQSANANHIGDAIEAPQATMRRLVKRLFDVAFAGSALIFLFPLLMIVAIAMKMMSGGPIFFAHMRVGMDGKLFPCLKFRTMEVDAAARLAQLIATDPAAAAEFAATQKLRNDPRIIPRIGPFLRKSSLDELPQFLNVLFGHMSIVGPRPVTQEEWVKYYGTEHGYTDTRPGITGLWQVSGRNDVGYTERVDLDSGYIANWTFSGDLRIIVQTIKVVCIQRNGH